MKSKWNEEKENLEKLINEDKLSYEEIGRRYGCTGSNIRKVVERLNIDVEPRRVINPNETFSRGIIRVPMAVCANCGKEFRYYRNALGLYCSNKCQQEYQHKQRYQLILNGDPSIMRANYNPRIFKDDILSEQDGKCAICGMTPEWNGKPLVFVLDHIDGHSSNNKRDNLRMICPNCDSQLDTYKSKNKNGERSYYRYHKFEKDQEISN